MAAKAKMYWSSFSVFILTGAMFEMATVASSWTRHYVPILGPINPPFSGWSWNPHPVRQSKLDNLFTYLPSRRGDPSDHLVDAHIMAARGMTACAAYRCFELSFQFMHDHDDLQWLSHGACTVDIHIRSQREPGCWWTGYMWITSEPTNIFMQIISENISLSYISNF